MKTFKEMNAFITTVAITVSAALPAMGQTQDNNSLSMVTPKPPTASTLPLSSGKMIKTLAKQTRQKQQKDQAKRIRHIETDQQDERMNNSDGQYGPGLSVSEPDNAKSAVRPSSRKQRNSVQEKRRTNTNNGESKSRKLSPAAQLAESYLRKGKLTDGEMELTAQLEASPNDDNIRFGLGIVQFLGAVQKLSQDLYRYGIRNPAEQDLRIPFLRLNIPANPHPETISYEKARTMMDGVNKRLLQAAATLAEIKDPNVMVPLHFGMISLDLNGDGTISEKESLWKLYSHLNRSNLKAEDAEKFTIAFDRGDVHWLKGYCHLLSSFLEVYLAYDSKDMFDRTAHMFFQQVDTPYKFLKNGTHIHRIGSVDILDVVAFVHLINWEVAEPQRMETALHDWEEVVAQSRTSWKFVMAETDNDREWLPNPDQNCVIPNMKVSQQMIESWGHIMNEIDLLLKGERLIPFWRSDENRPNYLDQSPTSRPEIAQFHTLTGTGINVRKIFMEPRKLDLVLWVQGTAAAPYLEKGRLTQGSDWRDWQDEFGGNFPGFAAFFN